MLHKRACFGLALLFCTPCLELYLWLYIASVSAEHLHVWYVMQLFIVFIVSV